MGRHAQHRKTRNPEDIATARMGDEQIRTAIEERAYARYLARGAESGQELEDWLEAEREVRERSRETK